MHNAVQNEMLYSNVYESESVFHAYEWAFNCPNVKVGDDVQDKAKGVGRR